MARVKNILATERHGGTRIDQNIIIFPFDFFPCFPCGSVAKVKNILATEKHGGTRIDQNLIISLLIFFRAFRVVPWLELKTFWPRKDTEVHGQIKTLLFLF